MRLLFFGRHAFLGAAYGGKYLIAASSGVDLNVSMINDKSHLCPPDINCASIP
jgi:hypothetical protein